MVIDYKHVAFSFDYQKRKKRLKKLKIIALVVVFLLAVFLFQYFQQDKKIKKIQDLLLNDRQAEATELFKTLKNSILHGQTIKELNALINLFSGDVQNAHLILNSLGKPKTSISTRRFLNYFAEQSKYDELKIYTDYLINKQESVHFFKALYLTSFFKYRESETQLGRISSGQQKLLNRAIDLVSDLNTKLKSGKVDYIFDKNGKPLAHYDLKARKTVSVTPGMHFDEFTPRFEKGIKTYTLSLDLNIQNKIDRVFKKYRGSMILFKIEDSGILAAFSKPRQPMKSNAVFSAEFEPGSIIKTLTLFAFYLNPKKDLFPFECRRAIRLSNRDFPDRIAHGIIENPQYALVVSCNIAFARMGIAVGFKSLSHVLDSFFFNSKGFKDQFFTFNTGSYNLNISGDYQLANLAVGLNNITSTTFHSGLMALIIAQNGSINRPYLIKNKKNILNLGFYNHQSEIVSVFENNPIFFKISQAMVEVVENRLGTGRHSKVQFVKTAIKTGTAGQKKQGLNSIIMGFFPAAKPEYAFAFILEGAGKAELNGAYLLKEFLGLFYE